MKDTDLYSRILAQRTYRLHPGKPGLRELLRRAQNSAYDGYGKSIRQIARETGHDRKTIKKVLLGKTPSYKSRGAQPYTVESWAGTVAYPSNVRRPSGITPSMNLSLATPSPLFYEHGTN